MDIVRGSRGRFKDVEEGHNRQEPRRGKDRVAYADMVRGSQGNEYEETRRLRIAC
jgi:hypothetical protein